MRGARRKPRRDSPRQAGRPPGRAGARLLLRGLAKLEGAFDLVVSATAFHWADPSVRYRKSARALRSEGSLALIWNTHDPEGSSEGFAEALDDVHRRTAPELAPERRPLRLDREPDKTGEIGRSGYFGRPEEHRYRFGVAHESGSYPRLLGTHSSHRALEGRTRQRLFAAVARPIDEGHGGRRVGEGYRSELYVARRLSRRRWSAHASRTLRRSLVPNLRELRTGDVRRTPGPRALRSRGACSWRCSSSGCRPRTPGIRETRPPPVADKGPLRICRRYRPRPWRGDLCCVQFTASRNGCFVPRAFSVRCPSSCGAGFCPNSKRPPVYAFLNPRESDRSSSWSIREAVKLICEVRCLGVPTYPLTPRNSSGRPPRPRRARPSCTRSSRSCSARSPRGTFCGPPE